MKTIYHASVRSEILERLERLRAGSPRQWGSMSVGGMVCHLTDGFDMAFGDLPVQMRDTLFARTVIRFVAFHTPMKWPPGATTAPELAQEHQGTPPGDFADDVEGLKERIVRFAEADPWALAPHPLFGPMSAREWGRWGYRHVDHHLRQFGV